MIARWPFRLFLLTALGLVGFAGYLALFPPPEAPVFAIGDADRDLGEFPVGISPVTFTFTNQSDQPARILSFADGCGENCCFRSKHREQVVVRPREAFECMFNLDVTEPRPFAVRIRFYVSDPDIRPVELSIRGVGVTPGSAVDDKPTR